METPKQTQPSTQSPSAKSAPSQIVMPTPNAPSVEPATTSPASPSAKPMVEQLKDIDRVLEPANAQVGPPARPKEECIILLKAPNGTVHPLVNPPGQTPGCRVFDNVELAILEQTTNLKLSKFPSIVVPIGELL